MPTPPIARPVRPRTASRPLRTLALVGGALVLAVGIGAPALAAAPPSAVATGFDITRTAAPTTPPTALALLATLPVRGRAPMTGYQRIGDFGAAWLDVDRNGCDTRDDVLRRDLTRITGSGCHVLSGTLHDPYTGRTVSFVRGARTSTAVQIDHVVPLGDAWQTGAQNLTQTQRIELANDPIELLAVDGPTNEAKGDGDAATWLPPVKTYRCTYVAHQVSVKAAYHLWVTAAEKAAMRRILDTCPTQRSWTSTVAHVSGAAATPPHATSVPKASSPTSIAPVSSPTPSASPFPSDTVHYANCAAVRAAGKAPLRRGQPGYRAGLDRDGDGVACEG